MGGGRRARLPTGSGQHNRDEGPEDKNRPEGKSAYGFIQRSQCLSGEETGVNKQAEKELSRLSKQVAHWYYKE